MKVTIDGRKIPEIISSKINFNVSNKKVSFSVKSAGNWLYNKLSKYKLLIVKVCVSIFSVIFVLNFLSRLPKPPEKQQSTVTINGSITDSVDMLLGIGIKSSPSVSDIGQVMAFGMIMAAIAGAVTRAKSLFK